MIEAIFDRDLLNLGVQKSVDEVKKDSCYEDDEKTFFDTLTYLLGGASSFSNLLDIESVKIHDKFVKSYQKIKDGQKSETIDLGLIDSNAHTNWILTPLLTSSSTHAYIFKKGYFQ